MSMQEDWPNPEPKKRGMSGGMKLLLVLGGLGGFCMLLCCGGIAFLGYKARNMITTDPATIRERTQEIATIEVLPGFKPVQGMDVIFMKLVVYQGEQGDNSALLLMEFNSSMMDQGKGQKELRDQMLDQMHQQQAQHGGGAGPDTDIEVEESETRFYTIGGRKNEFLFTKGKSHSGKAMRQVTGTFPTAKGVAMLMLTVPEENYDEAAVVKMLESIRTPVNLPEEPGETTEAEEHPQASEAMTPEENEEAEDEKAEETPNS